MKFYRSLQPFKVISFDLDDTLYDNSQVIKRAVAEFLQYLQQASQIDELDSQYWLQWKDKVAQQQPLLAEEVTAWRVESMLQMLQAHGKTHSEAQQIAQQSIDYFLDWRHRIEVPAESKEVLAQLKKKYLLAVITNGNVSPQRIGLPEFDLYLRGGEHGRAKPHQDLFHKLAQHFHLQPHEILHVGDNLTTDVQGAIQAGCQGGWINLSGKQLKDFPEATALPTLEINELSQLLQLG